jgi:hypothetical protein
MNAGKMNQSGDSYHKQYNLFGDPGLEVFPVDLAPYVTVTSPNGGEKWEQGRKFYVTWDDNFDDNVKIELLKGSSVDQVLAASVSSEGLHEWDIPADFPLGTDYKIRVTCTVQDTLVDESDEAFTIEEKSNLELILPNGGEYIEKETDVEITWEDNLSGNVDIVLYRAGILYVPIASSVPSNGSYTWKVSDTIKSGSEYRVRVVSIDKDLLFDESDADLSIQNPVIKDFPYLQDFDDFQEETTQMRDYWEQLDDDDIEWTVYTGPTPSKTGSDPNKTGPDGDHPNESGNYVYIEASDPNNPSKKATIITPVFDLNFLSEGKCTFWYHMFSAENEMGELYIDISIDGQWQQGVVHLSGNNGDEWKQDTIDLADYTGKLVQFRFRGITGDSWCSDICVDYFEVKGVLNTLPEFTSTPDTAAEVDKEYVYAVAAKDGDGDPLTFGKVTLPSWLTLTDNGDGTAELKGTPEKDDVGDNDVVITVSDGVITTPVEQSYKIHVIR